MDQLVDLFANNNALKALATVGSLIALGVFGYQLFKRIYSYGIRYLDRTTSRNITDAKIGINNSSYLTAVLFYHFIVMLFFAWNYLLFDEVQDFARAGHNSVTEWIAQILKWVLGALIADRGANVWLISRRVIRETPEEDGNQ
ncbi:MAG TPA: hypothetical protein VFP12_05475 [Allosphingosinicella sp.]|nr:hypothetical protein [Allosphingosinicella sp.]